MIDCNLTKRVAETAIEQYRAAIAFCSDHSEATAAAVLETVDAFPPSTAPEITEPINDVELSDLRNVIRDGLSAGPTLIDYITALETHAIIGGRLLRAAYEQSSLAGEDSELANAVRDYLGKEVTERTEKT